MPSALETLVKILKLERDQGCQNTAVVGGLAAFATSWQAEAREQARRAHHHVLIDEIVDALSTYESLDGGEARIEKLGYLLDRVTGRQKAPAAYQKRLDEWQAKLATQSNRSTRRSSNPRRREHVDRRSARTKGRRGQHRFHAYDSASYDEDFTRGPSQSRLDIAAAPRLDRPPRLARAEQNLDEQLAISSELDGTTTEVRGIGKKFAELLSQLNLTTVRDLLYNLPRNYVDYTKLACIKDLLPDETANVIATVRRVRTVAGRAGKSDLLVEVSDGSGRMSIRFFSQPFLSMKLSPGVQLLLRGKVGFFRDMPQMASPEWEELDSENLRNIGIVPVYRMTKGLRPRLFRRTMKALVAEWATKLPDPLPLPLLDRNDLADLGWAIKEAHFLKVKTISLMPSADLHSIIS